MTGYSSGDAKLLPTLDLGTCSPTVVPGKTYNLSTWYQSTGITQFALYYRDSTGAWYYWTSSPWVATATAWTQATFTTPAVPANAVGMTFGLGLIANGTLTTDDYSLVIPASGGSGSAAVRAATAQTATGPLVSITKIKKHVHSHLKLLIPSRGKLRSGQSFPMPEWPGPHAKSPT